MKSNELHSIEDWKDILSLSRAELDNIGRLEGSFSDNIRRIIAKEFAERYPNQNNVYTLEGITTEFLDRISIYYKDSSLPGVMTLLTELGFTFPGIDVKTPNRRLHYLVLDYKTFLGADSVEDLLTAIDDFLFYNVPVVIADDAGDKLKRLKTLCGEDEELYTVVEGFESKFMGKKKPRLVSDVVIQGVSTVTEAKFALVRKALSLYYSLFYDASPYGTDGLNLDGEVYYFSYLGLPVVREIIYDVNAFTTEANNVIPYCTEVDEYDYVDFSSDSLVQSIDMSKIRDKDRTYGLPLERVELFHKVWDEVLKIKSTGKIPLLCFSLEVQSLERLITVMMVILEDVRVGIAPRGDIGRFLEEYSTVAKQCNCFAEDRIKYILDSPDSFFSFSNRELFFSTKAPNGTGKSGKGTSHSAPISIGYVQIEEDVGSNRYSIVSSAEKTVTLDLLQDDRRVFFSYKDLNLVSLEDSFAGMQGKEGRSYSISEGSNSVLCALFHDYEKLIEGVSYDSAFERPLKDGEFLSLRNCFFMLYKNNLYLARIMEMRNELSVRHSRFVHWNRFNNGELSEEELESIAFVEEDVTEDKMYRSCLPLSMLADYDGLGSAQEVQTEGGVKSVRFRIKPYVNTDGILGCLQLLHRKGRYTQQLLGSLHKSKQLGMDACAMGKFDLNSNYVYKSENSILTLMTVPQLRRLGYLTSYGGDNLVWKDGYVLNTDTFKKEKE